jgi:signal transduction histidine kinase
VRIVQESVSNAGRHGQASLVRITMGADNVLRISDNGAGFDTDGTAASASSPCGSGPSGSAPASRSHPNPDRGPKWK